ncbi:nuclear transport factor 2 family protein [Reyranella sp.]|uniref:nuclear transport factor 2 family protein n=1 Tax=Reyranella sp. TaxID=1929291 RepID=UPI003BACC25F
MDQSPDIVAAINGYLDLMYDSDDSRFPEVFHDACLIHGLREDKLVAWSASDFRAVMRGRPSPAALGAPRDQEILAVERTAPDLATAKVRVRIAQTGFIDHLVFHRLDGRWLVTSKAFHVAQLFPPGA